MFVREEVFSISAPADHERLLTYLQQACEGLIASDVVPIRFVITSTKDGLYECECGTVGAAAEHRRPMSSIFEFCPRLTENTQRFNVVLLVPTGIGAEIGGHAGDAGPVARMLGEICDTLIVHPNVVNASDINEMPENALYVEGSVITRLLLGTVGLESVRSNRILVVIDDHEDELFVNAAVNAVSSARATYGLACSEVVCLDPAVRLWGRFAPSGRAVGRIEELAGLCELLEDRSSQYDAVALSSIVDVPREFHQSYFDAGGGMVNPWGGVEAMLTHALSSIYNVPVAHSPMLETRDIAHSDPGIVDPRMAAEAVSGTFLNCTLKGLQKSPRIITNRTAMMGADVVTAADIACLVVPDGCFGLPTLAALEQGIRVIAVRENRNLMQNDIGMLPWRSGQFFRVDNYWEAAGVIVAMRAGIEPESVRRPLQATPVSKFAPVSSQKEPKKVGVVVVADG